MEKANKWKILAAVIVTACLSIAGFTLVLSLVTPSDFATYGTKEGYTKIVLDDSDILVIWLKHEFPENEGNLITYTDASSVKYNTDFLVVEHLTDGFISYSMNEIIAWGIDK